MTILQSERLLLHPLRDTDLDDLCLLNADPEVMRYLGDGRPRNREQVAERLRQMLEHWQKYGFGIWLVRARSDGRFLGRCGYGDLHGYADLELSYALRRDAWGKGYCSEAAQTVVQHAFEIMKLPRLLAVARPQNLASINVMRKLGMTFQEMINFQNAEAVLYALDNPLTRPAATAAASQE